MNGDNQFDDGEIAEGYRRRAQREMALVDELDGVSTEADEQLGDAPDW